MANEVRIVVTGDYKAGPTMAKADADVKKLDRSTSALADGGMTKAQRAQASFTDVAGKGTAVLGGLTLAAGLTAKVMGDGIAGNLAHANAEIALGSKGFGILTTAAQENANTLGFTETEFISTAGSAASLAKNLGFSQEAAAKLGAAFPDLADKLAVLANGKITTAEAADQLRSAMAGEFDPLQAAGIAINAAAVETEALKIQQQSATAITKEQSNAMAVLAIVQRQTADASKVMGTEAGRAAAEAQAAQAELRQAYEDLSQSAVPVLKEITQATAGWLEQWGNVVSSTSSLGERLEGLFKVMVPLTNIIDAVKGKTEGEADASKDAALNVAELADGATGAAGSQEMLAEATDKAVDSIKEQISVALGGRDAARGYQEALDESTASLEENGKTLDITTEAGRANSEALDRVARAALEQADAVREAGGSEADFQGQLDRSRRALEREAVRFGMTRGEARAYARQVLGIPTKANTKVFLDAAGAIRTANTVRLKIADIRGKTVYVNIRETTFRSAVDIGHDRGEKAGGGPVGAYGTAAAGGARSGLTLVGENGPELVPLPAGTMVHPASNTRGMLDRMGGGGAARAVLELRSSGRRIDDLLLEILRESIRAKGGDVQTVIGTGRGRSSV